jgi:outer membrane protein OmpA-like peptidoglycan-associated protein
LEQQEGVLRESFNQDSHANLATVSEKSRLQRIQRYSETTSVSGMGSGISPSTVTLDPLYGSVETVGASGPTTSGAPFLDFKSRIETVTLSEEVTGGRVRLHLFETAEINNILVNDRQWAVWDGIVPFTINGEQITFGSAIVESKPEGSGATLAVSVGNGVTTGGGYVSFSVTVAASGSQTTGGSIGIGPISGSAPVQGTTNFAGGMTRTFVVNLRTTPPRPINGPDISFAVGSERLLEGQEGAISGWFEALLEPVKDMIRNGRRAISISGYASTTGRRPRNRDLSERRARVVERILRGHAGSGATLNTFFLGEDNATTPDEKEDPRWRRVTIVVQVPSRMGPGVPGPPSST